MNNIDKLRNIIMKEQRILHPHRQGIMEVIYAFNQNEANLHDYIQRISKYLNVKMFNKFILKLIPLLFLAFMDNGQVMILCMLKSQANYMKNFKYFMVDMSYKRVFGEMNEFEFNAYDENNNSSKYWLRFKVLIFNFKLLTI